MASRASKRNSVVTYTRKDGSILRAKLEPRPEGTYAIDLRAFHRGRPTLKAPGDLRGTKILGEAKQYEIIEYLGANPLPALVTPGAAVTRERQSRGWSKKRLAQIAGVDEATVGRLEGGTQRMARRPTEAVRCALELR